MWEWFLDLYKTATFGKRAIMWNDAMRLTAKSEVKRQGNRWSENPRIEPNTSCRVEVEESYKCLSSKQKTCANRDLFDVFWFLSPIKVCISLFIIWTDFRTNTYLACFHPSLWLVCVWNICLWVLLRPCSHLSVWLISRRPPNLQKIFAFSSLYFVLYF